MRSEWMLIWMLSSSRWMTELERGFDELMIAEGPDLRSEDAPLDHSERPSLTLPDIEPVQPVPPWKDEVGVAVGECGLEQPVLEEGVHEPMALEQGLEFSIPIVSGMEVQIPTDQDRQSLVLEVVEEFEHLRST